MVAIITPPSPATFYSTISSEGGSMHDLAHNSQDVPLERLESTLEDRPSIAETKAVDRLTQSLQSSSKSQRSAASTTTKPEELHICVDIIEGKGATSDVDADSHSEGKPLNAVLAAQVAETPTDRLPPSPPLTPVASEENLRSTLPMRSQQSLVPEPSLRPWPFPGISTNNELSQAIVLSVLPQEQETDMKSSSDSVKETYGVIRKNGKKYRIPYSSYYFKPPPDTSAYGTAPLGHIGVHYPREIVRIERDYSGGEVVQFSPAYPLELEGRVTPTQFLETINAINEKLIRAHSLRWSFLDNTIAFLTLYISRLFFKSHYDKEMLRLQHLVDDLNRQLYNPMGLNILWPRNVAFLFLEIEYY